MFRNADEKGRAERLGLTDFDRKYNHDELVQGDAIFAATGVTKGAMVDGVRIEGGYVHTHTVVLSSASREQRVIRMRRPI